MLTWKSLVMGLGHKLMQVPPYPSRSVGLAWQQPAGPKDGSIPGRLGVVLGGLVMGGGCR